MPDVTNFAYDVVEYPDQWYPQTHPDRLATLGTLVGIDTISPEQCRFLELGCGAGWNLIHMAAGLPESTFVGVDLAAQAIERATANAAELGLSNITFQALDLAEVNESFGVFDYIVAHGVYSWVPEAVRDRLMAVSKMLLAPQGIVYISYATYPGRYLTQVFREMMLYYCHRFDDPKEKAKHARALLGFLREAQPEESAYRRLLEEEMKRISRFPDAFFYHDDLSEINAPCYFHQFAAHAATHGLQYVAEANFHEMQDHGLPEKMVEVWKGLATDAISYEQYRDFIVFRRFRQTLLSHQEVPVSRQVNVELMRRFFAAAPTRLVSREETEEGRHVVQYEGLKDAFVDTRSVLTHRAVEYLGEQWPRFVAFEDLVEEARRQALEQQPDRKATADEDAAEIAWLLLKLYGGHFLSLNVRAPQVVGAVGDRPETSRLARWQARSQAVVSNQVGEKSRLTNPLDRALVPLLDGTCDRDALRAALTAQIEAGALSLPDDDTTLDEQVEAALKRLVREALLIT